MKKRSFQVAGSLVFSLFILIISRSVIERHFIEFYNFIIRPTSEVMGSVIKSDLVEAPNVTVFNCTIAYVVKGKRYLLSSSISYDVNPDVRSGTPVSVRYNL